MDHPVLLLLVKTTIIAHMFAIGLNLSFLQLISLWSRPGLLLRSLLAVIVLVPLIVLVLLWSFGLPLPVATGLAVLAAAPGAPLLHKRSQMAGGGLAHSASLQLTLALLAVLIAPVTLGIFHIVFDLLTERVSSFEVARQVALVQLLPVSLALILGHFAPKITEMIGKPVNVFAKVLFLVLVVLALVPGIRTIISFEGMPILAIVITVAASLFVGHLLGGPNLVERAALAVASIARNIGLALFIATLGGVEKEIIPTLLVYMILGAIVAIPYSLWIKRRVAHEQVGLNQSKP